MSSTASFPLPQRRESAIFSDAETTKAIASSNSGSMCLSFILSLSLLTITLYFQLVLYHFTPSSTLHSTTLNLSAKQDPLPELFTPMTSVPSTLPPPRPLPALSTTESFLCGGLAACTAVTVCKLPSHLSHIFTRRNRSSSLLLNVSLSSSPSPQLSVLSSSLSKRVLESSHKLIRSPFPSLEHPRSLQD